MPGDYPCDITGKIITGIVGAFVGGVESGSLNVPGIAVLIAAALIGSVLLFSELKPRTSRGMRMKKGTYITRTTVKERPEETVRSSPEILQSSAKARRRSRPRESRGEREAARKSSGRPG